MYSKVYGKPPLSDHVWTVGGTAGWILWHLIAMLSLALGIVSASGVTFEFSKALLPAAMFSVAYLLLSLVIVPGGRHRGLWLFGLWFVASSVGLAAINLVLDLQQRSTQHGHRRHNTRNETENGCVNSTAEPH